jgi:hypothetical protein
VQLSFLSGVVGVRFDRLITVLSVVLVAIIAVEAKLERLKVSMLL